GEFATAINNSFGSFEEFKAQFKAESFKRFGSGWVWLVRDKNGRLEITSSPGQDNPIMEGKYPILGTDVWEHAYYLNYKNSRGSYVDAWWNTINWDEVNARFKESQTV
ncbi:superoxide dismutase, partial [Crocosphaera watsonii]